MSHVEKIEQAIMNLTPGQLAKFRAWYAAFDADRWDSEIETHVNADRLNSLVNEAIASYNRGEAKEI